MIHRHFVVGETFLSCFLRFDGTPLLQTKFASCLALGPISTVPCEASNADRCYFGARLTTNAAVCA